MKDEQPVVGAPAEEIDLGPGLQLIRRRRLYLWIVIAIYLPAMAITLRLSSAFSVAGTVFAVWFVLLFITALFAAAAKCPRCGNTFHMNGMTFLCLRRCLHCQLHVTADKKKKK